MKNMVDHRLDVQKKAKKRADYLKEFKEHKITTNQEKNEHKNMRLSDLQRNFLAKLQMIESKRTEREHVESTIKSAFGKLNEQKQEINQIKK